MKKKKESGIWGRGWKKEGQKQKLWLAAAVFGCLAFLAGWMTVKTMREQKMGVIEAARMEREKTEEEKDKTQRAAAEKNAEEEGSRVLGFRQSLQKACWKP